MPLRSHIFVPPCSFDACIVQQASALADVSLQMAWCANSRPAGGLSRWRSGGGSRALTNKGQENADSGALKRLMLRACQATGNGHSNISTRQLTGVLSCACLFLFFSGCLVQGFRLNLQAASSHRVPLCLEVSIFALARSTFNRGRVRNPPGPELRTLRPFFCPSCRCGGDGIIRQPPRGSILRPSTREISGCFPLGACRTERPS